MRHQLVRPHVQVEVADASLPVMLLRRTALEQWQRTGRTESDDYRILPRLGPQVRGTVLDPCRTAHRLQTVTTWVDDTASLTAGVRYSLFVDRPPRR